MARATKASKKSRKRKLRLAFISSEPSAALLHLPGFKSQTDAKIVALTTLNGTRLPSNPAYIDASIFEEDYVRMIETVKPDAVYVITSPLQRYDIAATVLEMGCNLFINKPPAITSEQFRQLGILAKKQKAITGVVFYRRFSPLLQRGLDQCMKRGPVHSAVTTFYKNSIGRGPYLRGGIDALTSDAIHAVDTLRHICGGEVESVASNVRRLGAEHTNAHEALVRFTNDAVGIILTNFMCGRRMFTVEIHSPGVSFFGDLEEGGRLFADGKTEPSELVTPLPSDHPLDRYQGLDINPISLTKAAWHTDVNRHFLDCIRKNKQPITNFDDALKTMELVDAIYRSQI